MSYFDENANPWLVDYAGGGVQVVEVEDTESIKKLQERVWQWKEYADGLQEQFDKTLKLKNQREAQAVAWRDVVKEMVAKYDPELSREEINAIFDKHREAAYAIYRAEGRPI